MLVKFRERLHAHPKIHSDTVRVRFAGFSQSSLDIGVRIYALTRDFNEFYHPESEVWLIYGDGAAGFILQEFDTFVRHKVPVIAVVGNDAGWTQIARDQVAIFGDDVASVLRRSDYHRVAEGFGAKGFLLDRKEDIDRVFKEAKQAAKDGQPVLINALIGKTDFRKGSISM